MSYKYTAEKLADYRRQISELRNLPAEDIGSQTTLNFYKFFGLAVDNADRTL